MEAGLENKKAGIKDLMPFTSFMKMLCANCISRFGDSIDAIAFSWMVYILTGSRLLMGTILAVNCIPNIIFSPIAGVFSDRIEKKKAIVAGDIGRGLMVTLTAVLFLTNTLRPWHLFIITFINSTFETFSNPSRMAVFPLIMNRELLMQANAFSGSATRTAEIIGMALAGAIIGFAGISGAIFIDAATFFISALIICFTKINGDEARKSNFSVKSYGDDIKEGFRFIKGNKLISTTIIVFAFMNFFFTPINALEAVYVKDILKTGPEGMSFIGTGVTAGMILGGLLVAQFGSRFKSRYMTIIGIAAMGICYALLGLPAGVNFVHISPLVFAVVFYTLFGFSVPVITSPLMAHIMGNIPKELMGRVGALLGMVSMSIMPLGYAVTGIAAEYVNLFVLFIVMGIMTVGIAVVLFFNREFKKLQEQQ